MRSIFASIAQSQHRRRARAPIASPPRRTGVGHVECVSCILLVKCDKFVRDEPERLIFRVWANPWLVLTPCRRCNRLRFAYRHAEPLPQNLRQVASGQSRSHYPRDIGHHPWTADGFPRSAHRISRPALLRRRPFAWPSLLGQRRFTTRPGTPIGAAERLPAGRPATLRAIVNAEHGSQATLCPPDQASSHLAEARSCPSIQLTS